LLKISRPPGSGKTKTIVAIVGALLSDSLKTTGLPGQAAPATKKLLVCAPSNAAVDELVMRFKTGVRTLHEQPRSINVVRLGRSDAINSNVQDVTLEELVKKKLANNPNKQDNKQREETQKLMTEHQQVSEKLRQARDALNNRESKEAKSEFDELRRLKSVLGNKIDHAKDQEKNISRQVEMERKRAQQMVLDEAHVICATLSGSGHDMFQNMSLDLEAVVVDEAAQCVEASALIPLKYGTAKCILVGDPKQLPPTVFSKVASRFQYEQSLFVRMQTSHPNDIHLLDTQYRMHPDISVFPSTTFYNGRLLDGPDMAQQRQRPWHGTSLLSPYRFFDVRGQHQAAPRGHSLINLAEIDVAMQLYERLITDFGNLGLESKIGIITPYKSQLSELKNRFSNRYGDTILETVEFNTTDAFQGRESEVIIFSCVRASSSGNIGFLQDIRRMNVGLTRAKSSLWVLGNSESLMRGEFWAKLIVDAKARGRFTQGNYMAELKQRSRITEIPAMHTAPVATTYEQPGRSVLEESSRRSSATSIQEINDTEVADSETQLPAESSPEPAAAAPAQPAVSGSQYNFFGRAQPPPMKIRRVKREAANPLMPNRKKPKPS
jgi:senataxin